MNWKQKLVNDLSDDFMPFNERESCCYEAGFDAGAKFALVSLERALGSTKADGLDCDPSLIISAITNNFLAVALDLGVVFATLGERHGDARESEGGRPR